MPAGAMRKEPSELHARRRKKLGNVSSKKRLCFNFFCPSSSALALFTALSSSTNSKCLMTFIVVNSFTCAWKHTGMAFNPLHQALPIPHNG